VGDCTATDFEDGSFDIISCAFGVRNMANPQKGLREMHRLLRPGGRACILEFTLPKNLLIRALYMVYFRWILPLIGGVISGKLSAYRYLADSVCKWAEEVDLAGQLKEAGFDSVEVRPLSFGIAALYLAVRK
jgi:demethylmenaquinone methyltransferase/2-methoxy-6-polyprenyl-1,4-benzoquinol methylase